MGQHKNSFLNLPTEGRARVVIRTLAVLLPTTLLAIGGTYFSRVVEGRMPTTVELVTTLVMTFFIGGPVVAFLLSKLEELRVAYVELARYAKLDALTGLYNRGALISQVEKAAVSIEDETADVGSLMVIDVDFFKSVNDTHGHDAGDQALQLIAAALQKHARPQDLIGRLGGEEFAVFLHGCDLKAARVVAERMRRAVEEVYFAPNGIIHRLTISIGLSAWSVGAEFREINKEADIQLYAAKDSGRNRVMSVGQPVFTDRREIVAA